MGHMACGTGESPRRRDAGRSALTRDNLGFLLAKASRRWNELLYERFVEARFPEVRPAYGALLSRTQPDRSADSPRDGSGRAR